MTANKIIQSALESKSLNYNIMETNEIEVIYKMGMSLDSGKVSTYIKVNTESNFVLTLHSLHINVPASFRIKVAEYINRVNYNLTLGNFEMDFSDGEIRFRTIQPFEDTFLFSHDLFIMILKTGYAAIDKYYAGIMAIIYGNKSAEMAQNEIENILNYSLN